jgi:hypothetical protein
VDRCPIIELMTSFPNLPPSKIRPGLAGTRRSSRERTPSRRRVPITNNAEKGTWRASLQVGAPSGGAKGSQINAVWPSLATSMPGASEALQLLPQILYLGGFGFALHLVNTCRQKQGGFSDSLGRRRAPGGQGPRDAHPPVPPPPVLYTPLLHWVCWGADPASYSIIAGVATPDPKGPVLCRLKVGAYHSPLPADTRLRPCRVEGAPQLAVWLSRKQKSP